LFGAIMLGLHVASVPEKDQVSTSLMARSMGETARYPGQALRGLSFRIAARRAPLNPLIPRIRAAINTR